MSEPSWIGKAIGERYQIEEDLGAGGMSTVYRATDLNLRRTVAVKLIHRHLSRDPEFVRRFEAEATVVARLKHPNIVQVYDFDNDGGTYYIVFEYVAGESLQERLVRLADAKRILNEQNSVTVAASIADALQYAHEREVIHRDVKPANIMLDQSDQAILTDFGIAKIVGGTQHTASGVVLGTARYVSPEQVQGRPVTAQSDLYSLGATLFEMLAGRAPYEGDSVVSVLMAHVSEPLPDLQQLRPNISPGLVAAVNKAMAKEPSARFQTAGDMARALRTGSQAVPVIGAAAAATAPAAAAGAATMMENVPPPPPPGPEPTAAASTPSGPFSGRSILALVGGLALLLVLCAAVVIGYFLIVGDDGTTAGAGDETLELTETAESESTMVALLPSATRQATATATPSPTATPTEAPTEAPTEMPTNSPTATNTPAPTLAPTQPAATATPPPPDVGLSAQITNITLQDGRYVVNYQTGGFTEALPGEHVHFFFDTVSPENAGVPGSGPWILYGGPRPFTQYTAADRPSGASQMCVLVANPNHSIQPGSGNCFPLPN
jgi:serine/threonine-protein kinase